VLGGGSGADAGHGGGDQALAESFRTAAATGDLAAPSTGAGESPPRAAWPVSA